MLNELTDIMDAPNKQEKEMKNQLDMISRLSDMFQQDSIKKNE